MLRETYISLLDKIGPWVFINTRDLNFIDGFHSYFGIQDIVLLTLGILLYRQIKKTDNRTIKITGLILYFILFLYFFPDFAATFEAQRVLYFEKVNDDLIDGFNLLYVWGRFPTYWLCGILIVIIDKSIKKKRATTTVAIAQPSHFNKNPQLN